MEDKIVITVKGFGITHIAEIDTEATSDEIVEIFTKMAESLGYSPELVREGLQAAKEYRE